MALALDGFKVLRRIGKNTECFSDIAAEVNKTARALLLKQLRAKKAAPLQSVRDVAEALGGETFGLLVDAMTDAEVKAVLTKLDRDNPQFKLANANERRIHLVALADGKAEPVQKPQKAKGAKGAGKAGATEPPRLSSEAMAAVRRRG